MWKRLGLRSRIYVILCTLVFITIVGGAIMVWYTFRIQTLLTDIIDKNVAGFQAAEALETALVNQKGFVSYYFLDGDPDWLRQLGEYRQIFKQRLTEARMRVETEREKKAMDLIESEYARYIKTKDAVISHYQAGEEQIGSQLHQEVRIHFFKILELCNDYKQFNSFRIKEAREKSHKQAKSAQPLRIITR